MNFIKIEDFLGTQKEQEMLNGPITQITVKDRTPKKTTKKKYPKYNIPSSTKGTRIICVNKELGEWILIFEPTISAKSGYLDVYLVGETNECPVKIKWAKDNENRQQNAKGNRIENLTFEKGIPVKLKIGIEQKGYYCMALKAQGKIQ